EIVAREVQPGTEYSEAVPERHIAAPADFRLLFPHGQESLAHRNLVRWRIRRHQVREGLALRRHPVALAVVDAVCPLAIIAKHPAPGTTDEREVLVFVLQRDVLDGLALLD